MACGSGKTFTSLKIAEKIFPHGKILFLVPSISLLNQSLEEWAAFSENPINAICVCSDSTASNVDDEISQLPATKVAGLGSETPNCLDTADLLQTFQSE